MFVLRKISIPTDCGKCRLECLRIKMEHWANTLSAAALVALLPSHLAANTVMLGKSFRLSFQIHSVKQHDHLRMGE